MDPGLANPYPCIILAAGTGSRMGGRSKLLLSLGEKTVLVRALEAASAFCDPLVVVTGEDDEALRTNLEGFNTKGRSLSITHNTRWREGRVSSLICGMDALKGEYGGFFIAHADMPFVDASVYLLLAGAARVRTASGLQAAVIFPSCDGRRGHPVFIPDSAAPGIQALRRGESLKALMETLRCIDVKTTCKGIFEDLDTPGDYMALSARYGFSPGSGALKGQT